MPPARCIFGSWDSWFYAVDAATGKEKWRFHGGEDALIHNQVGFQSSPAVVDGVVYTGCRDSNVYALDAATGQEKWRVNNQGSWVNSSPAVAGGKVYFGTSDSSLFHAVDAATGKPVFKQQLKAYVFSSPSVAGDVVYLGILNGTMEARDRDTGELLWTFQTEASKREPQLDPHRRGQVQPADVLSIQLARGADRGHGPSVRASGRSSPRRWWPAAWSTSAARTAPSTRSSKTDSYFSSAVSVSVTYGLPTSCASTTATAATCTMSLTSLPRCNTCTGRLKPVNSGPISSAPPTRCSSL